VTGEQLAEVSNAVVGILAECYGRGPTKAKTYALDRFLVCVEEDFLTTVEETLIERGREDLVRQVRMTFQEEIAERFKGAVAAIVGREVVTYHSQVTFHPPTGFEVFVLDE
jgi:uncharacterized protein YbcI